MLFTFDLNTTYYIAIAVHKLDNNNLHYKTNKQTNNVASVRLAIGHLLQLNYMDKY